MIGLRLVCSLVLGFTISISAWAWQEPRPEVRSNPDRPASSDLLPENTVVYLQMHSVKDFVERMNESSAGKALANEKVAALVDRLYGEVKNQYEKVRDRVGVSLDELTTLLTGEFCFAVAAFKDRQPGVVLMFDYDPNAETLPKLLESGRKYAADEGAEFESESEADIEIQVVHTNDDDVNIYYFMSQGTFVAASDRELITEMLARWRGEEVEKVRPLSQNRKFITIMNRCRGTKEAPPEMRAYFDPIDLAKALTRGNFGARVVINSLQVVGLDGLLAAGGSVIYEEDGYESITHGHVLMANPRAGILEMTALAPGDLTPESWVPDETISYLSWKWDVDRMYTELEKMVDAFQGEGALGKFVEENFNKRLELNLRDDMLAALSGRLTYVTWFEKPPKLNSQTNAIAIEIKDPEKFKASFEKIIDKILERANTRRDEPMEPKNDYRGIACWEFEELAGRDRRGGRNEPGQDEDAEEDRGDEARRASMRVSYPNIALTDTHLIVSDSRPFMEKAIDTLKDEGPALRDNAEFAQVSRHMKRLLGTSVPGGIIYSRPDRSLEMLYEFARSESARDLLNRGSEQSEVLSSFKKVIDENPLPDWSELKDFFAPTGMFVTSDETGVHVLGFQLKPGDNR